MIPIWVLKVVLLADVLFVAGSIAEYWLLTKGGWMHDSVGLSLTIKDLIILAILGLTVLSVFFGLSRFDSEVIAWTQVSLLAAVAVVMAWRMVVFWRERDR